MTHAGPDWGSSFASAPTSSMRIYDEIMVPRMFEPWAGLLLHQVPLRSGQAVIDIACGPGTVTRLAANRVGPTGRVTGCDFSPAMLEVARSKSPLPASAPVDYLECSAESLTVPDDTFDVVTCQQGLQFFPDRAAALAEMLRFLRDDGRLIIAVWCAIAECPPFAAMASALRRVLGTEAALVYESGPWGFGDAEALAKLVAGSGFSNVAVKKFELPLVFEGGHEQLFQTLHATSIATTLAAMSDGERSVLSQALEETSRPITVDGAIRSYATSHIVTARLGENTE